MERFEFSRQKSKIKVQFGLQNCNLKDLIFAPKNIKYSLILPSKLYIQGFQVSPKKLKN